MATYDRTTDQGAVPYHRGKGVYTMQAEIDMALAGAGAAAPVVASDVIKVLRLPKGSIVLAAGLFMTRIPVGTELVMTFDETSGKGLNLAGTATPLTGSTAGALGKLYPATLTTPLIDAKAASTDSEDVYLTLTMTTMTAITDAGKYKVYATLADLNVMG